MGYCPHLSGLPDGTDKRDPSTGGHLPEVKLYDEFGKEWGRRDEMNKLSQGAFKDYHINSRTSERPAYIKITADKKEIDALCINAIQLWYPDIGSVVILGDVGVACNWTHHPSISELDTENGKPYQPICMWVDGDNSYGYEHPQTIAFHLRDFAGRDKRTMEAYEKDEGQICNAQLRMAKYLQSLKQIPVFSPPLRYREDRNPNNVDKKYLNDPKNRRDTFKRDLNDTEPQGAGAPNSSLPAATVSKKGSRYASTWVAANGTNPDHSALRVCNTTSTFGPDFANRDEGKYCDMSTRITLPLCGETVTSACFDIDAAFRDGNRFGTFGTFTQQAGGSPPVPKKSLTERINLIGHQYREMAPAVSGQLKS